MYLYDFVIHLLYSDTLLPQIPSSSVNGDILSTKSVYCTLDCRIFMCNEPFVPVSYTHLKIMLPKDYLAYRLSGSFCTDVSDASGMLLLDVKNRCWSKEMLEICGITEEQLPNCLLSHLDVYKRQLFYKNKCAYHSV